mgnify:CR=1 FL=1
MLFDKNLFESKYVPAEQRTPVDTLILIGNGFDIWQNLDTATDHLKDIMRRIWMRCWSVFSFKKKYTKI